MGIFGRGRFGERCPPKEGVGLSDVRDLVGLGESKAWECGQMPHLPYLYDSIGEEVSGSHRTMIQNGEADAHSQGDFVCRPSDALDAVGIRFSRRVETEIFRKIK